MDAPTAPFRLAKRFYCLAVSSATLLALTGLWFWADGVPAEQKILSALLIVLSVVPLALYFLIGRWSLLPLMALNSLFYAVAIGSQGFHFMDSSNWRLSANADAITLALQVTIVGLAAQVAAYYLGRFVFRTVRPIRFVRDLRAGQLGLIAWLLALVRVVTIVLPVTLAVPSLDQFALLCSSTSIAVLYALYLQRQLAVVEQILLFAVLFPVEVIVRLNTGLLANLMLLGLLIGLVRWVVAGRIPWLAFGLVTLVVVAVSPVKQEYRNQVWWNPKGWEMGPFEKSKLIIQLTADYWLDPSSSHPSEAVGHIHDRFDQLAVLSVVVEETPHHVPYWAGESYYGGMYFFIPRVIWPDKPTITTGREFGHRYGFLDPQDQHTSINLPWITEFYANFGLPGVLVGMAFIGLAFAFIERRFGHPGSTKIDAAIALAITFGLVYPESSLALMWGGLFTCMVTLILMIRAVRGLQLG